MVVVALTIFKFERDDSKIVIGSSGASDLDLVLWLEGVHIDSLVTSLGNGTGDSFLLSKYSSLKAWPV